MNIEYFAYYSVGGYKDMYLGDLNTKSEFTYYSPFYNQWKNGTLHEGYADKMKSQFEFIEDKEQISIMSAANNLMPKDASTFVVHSGFKLACSNVGIGKVTIAIKDLIGNDKDENGRSLPFMMQLIGDTPSTMIALSEYIRENLKAVSEFLSTLFEFNAKYNCLQFNIGKLNSWIKDVIDNKLKPYVQNAISHKLHLLVLSDGINKDYALKEIGISHSDVERIYTMNGNLVYDCKHHKYGANNDAHAYNGNAELTSKGIIDSLMALMGRLFVFTTEDKADFEIVKEHIRKIVYRHIFNK